MLINSANETISLEEAEIYGAEDVGLYYTGSSRVMTYGYVGSDGEFRTPTQVVDGLLGDGMLKRIRNRNKTAQDFAKDVQRTARRKGLLVAPVTVYEHGLVSYELGCIAGMLAFDYSFCGFIVTSVDQVREQYGVKRITKKVMEHVEQQWRADLAELSNLANGWRYIISLRNADGDILDETEIKDWISDDDLAQAAVDYGLIGSDETDWQQKADTKD